VFIISCRRERKVNLATTDNSNRCLFNSLVVKSMSSHHSMFQQVKAMLLIKMALHLPWNLTWEINMRCAHAAQSLLLYIKSVKVERKKRWMQFSKRVG